MLRVLLSAFSRLPLAGRSNSCHLVAPISET